MSRAPQSRGLGGLLQSCHTRGLLLPVFILAPAAVCVLTPFYAFVLPHIEHGLLVGGVVAALVLVLLGSYGLLRYSDPGYVLTDPFHQDPALAEPETVATLHKWAVEHPTLVAARDAADEQNDTNASVCLASSTQDAHRKETLTHILKRMSDAHRHGEEGAGDLEDAMREMQALVGPPVPPPTGYSITDLPPPPTRPHFVAPTAWRHPVVAHDAEEAAKQEALTATTGSAAAEKAARKARKKERKAREEKARYEQRRRDGEMPADAAPLYDSALADQELREQSMASATEEEDDFVVRSRAAAASTSAVSANPYASADAFFKHDFHAHPIDEGQRTSLIARAREMAASANGGSGERPPSDAFFIGNPRWHPSKVRDDLDRFAMDRFGLREEFCLECMLWRPLGAKHCHKCNLCVHQWVSHNVATGCCVGRATLRWQLVIQWCMFLLAAIGAWYSVKLFFAADTKPLEWASWRVPTGAMSETGTPVYTWSYRVPLRMALAGGWLFAAVIALAFLVFFLLDYLKASNYILLAEGDGLRADAPLQRMRMNPLQLLLYADIDSMFKYFFERIWFQPIESKAIHRTDALRLARARRREWRQMRETLAAQQQQAIAVQATGVHGASSLPATVRVSQEGMTDAPSPALSPHHAVDLH